MLNTYIVEGGIGKCASFSSLCETISEKNEIQILSPHYLVFAGNPNVKTVFDSSSINLTDSRIINSDNIFYTEPYKSNFVKGKEHIVESYCKLLNIEYSSKMVPKLYTEYLGNSVKDWKEKHSVEKYILLQFTGGQSIFSEGSYISNNFDKNYPINLAQKVINLLLKNFPEYSLIDCTLPNEPAYEGTIKCDLHWSEIHELLKGAKGWIGIDSFINHFSASSNTPGVVMWGNTRWTQFGYTHNFNICSDKVNIVEDTDLGDPRNILSDPELIVEIFKENVFDNYKKTTPECAIYDR